VKFVDDDDDDDELEIFLLTYLLIYSTVILVLRFIQVTLGSRKSTSHGTIRLDYCVMMVMDS